MVGNPEVTEFDCSVFDGRYVTGDVDAQYLESLDAQRNDEAQEQLRLRLQGEGGVVGLYNDVSSSGYGS